MIAGKMIAQEMIAGKSTQAIGTDKMSARVRIGSQMEEVAGEAIILQMRTLAGIRLRADAIRNIARGRLRSMMRRQIAEMMGARLINVDRNITGGIKISEMRSKSAEVLLFLNFVHLTLSWVPRPMGWP